MLGVVFRIVYTMYNVHSDISRRLSAKKEERAREKTSSRCAHTLSILCGFRRNKLIAVRMVTIFFAFRFACFLLVDCKCAIKHIMYNIGIGPSSNQKMIRSIEKNARAVSTLFWRLFYHVRQQNMSVCAVCWNANKTVYVLINKVEWTEKSTSAHTQQNHNNNSVLCISCIARHGTTQSKTNGNRMCRWWKWTQFAMHVCNDCCW